MSPVGTEYAYDSIMHYGPYSFNRGDKPTIVPRIGYFLDVIGQRKTFSTLDAARINTLYHCADPIRKTFNCNFNLMNICGFVNQVEPEGETYAKVKIGIFQKLLELTIILSGPNMTLTPKNQLVVPQFHHHLGCLQSMQVLM